MFVKGKQRLRYRWERVTEDTVTYIYYLFLVLVESYGKNTKKETKCRYLEAKRVV